MVSFGGAIMMIEQDTPHLPAYDHEAIAVAARYNEQDFRTVVAEFLRSRRETHAFFSGLTDEQRERADLHPGRGHFTTTDAGTPGRPPPYDPPGADRQDPPSARLNGSFRKRVSGDGVGLTPLPAAAAATLP